MKTLTTKKSKFFGLTVALYLNIMSATAHIYSEQAKLLADDGAANDFFSYSIALSDDTALISANRDNDKGENSGSVYIYDIK